MKKFGRCTIKNRIISFAMAALLFASSFGVSGGASFAAQKSEESVNKLNAASLLEASGEEILSSDKIANEIKWDRISNMSEDIAGAAVTYGSNYDLDDFSEYLDPGEDGTTIDEESFVFTMQYKNEGNNLYNVSKKDDFPLMYEITFSAKKGIAYGEARIYLDASLFKLRNGEWVNPDQIGIPKCTVDENGNIIDFKESSNSFFNYYETVDPVTQKKMVVMVNYKEIKPGDRTLVQIHYDNISCFDIIDGTTWALNALVKVGNEETGYEIVDTSTSQGYQPLTGDVDTYAELKSTSKKVYKDPTVSYTPELYSLKQVSKYLGTTPGEPYVKNGSLNQADYFYMLWEITNTGVCNQTWDLFMEEVPGNGGEVVGISTKVNNSYIPAVKVTPGDAIYPLNEIRPDDEDAIKEMAARQPDLYLVASTNGHEEYKVNRLKEFRLTYYAVIAYPKSLLDIPEGEEVKITNDVNEVLRPADGKKNKKGTGAAYHIPKAAEGTYDPYEWEYRGDTASFSKNAVGTTNLYAWLDAYHGASVNNEETYGAFKYDVTSTTRTYSMTHKGLYDGAYDEYTGGYVHTTVADNALYVQDIGLTNNVTTTGVYTAADADGTKATLLTKDDYYYKEMNVTLSELTVDVMEDTTEPVDKDTLADVDIDPSTPDVIDTFDSNWYVYVKYGKCDDASSDTGWKLAKTVTWDEYVSKKDSKKQTMSFGVPTSLTVNEGGAEHTYTEPYQIKVEHNTITYSANTTLSVTATIKTDSPVMNNLYQESTKDKYAVDDGGYYSIVVDNVASFSTEEKGTHQYVYAKKDNTTGKYVYELTDTPLTAAELEASGKIWVSGPGKHLVIDKTKSHSAAGVDGSQGAFTSEHYPYIDTIVEDAHKSILDGSTIAYDSISVADAAEKILPMTKRANAIKKANAKNNPNYGRVDLNYTIAGYEGYNLYSEGVRAYITSERQIRRNEVEIYDLLPEFVQYNGAVEPLVARIDRTDPDNMTNSQKFWDYSQVKLVNTYIENNYNNTNRTLVKFTIRYEGADCTKYDGNQQMWYAGYAVNFSAYVPWSDYENVKGKYNISAYMPGIEEGNTVAGAILGSQIDVAYDDGTPCKRVETIWADQYQYKNDAGDTVNFFKQDINGDGKTDIRNVLYASDTASTTIAIATASGIVKKVRVENESNKAAEYLSTADSGYEDKYTYEITLTNSNQNNMDLSDIVIFDHIENSYAEKEKLDLSGLLNTGANVTRLENEITWGEQKLWTGTLLDFEINSLIAKGILVKIYVSENVEESIPKLSSNEEDTVEIDFDGTSLDTENTYNFNNWKEYISYEIVDGKLKKNVSDSVDLAKVKSFAMDLHEGFEYKGGNYVKLENGYKLPNDESLVFHIQMKAPAKPEIKPTEVEYAFNNTYYYAIEGEAENTHRKMLPSNITAVALGDNEQLIIKKDLPENQKGVLSDAAKQEEFEFYIETPDKKSAANKKYTLWQLNAAGEYEILNEGVYQTVNPDSTIRLTAGQMALFKDIRYAQTYKVVERTDSKWEVEDVAGYMTAEELTAAGYDIDTYVHDFINHYQPQVLVTKDIYPATIEFTKEQKTFTYTVTTVEGEPVKDAKVYHVDKTTKKPLQVNVNGVTQDYIELTGEDGSFTFCADEAVILMLPEQLGKKVKITELTPDDWYCEAKDSQKTVTVLEKDKPVTVNFINDYKYKKLELTKVIQHANLIENRAKLGKVHFKFELSYSVIDSITGLEITGQDGLIVKHPYPGPEAEVYDITFDGSEILKADGSVSKTITIDDIPSFIKNNDGSIQEIVYYIQETDIEIDEDSEFISEDFSKINYIDTVQFGQRVEKEKIELTNDYTVRGLSVTKQVIAKEIPLDREFTLYLYNKNREAISGKEYVRDDGTTGVTGELGEFIIHANENIIFKNLGRVGDYFYIAEKVDKDYTPLSLAYIMEADGSYPEKTELDKFMLGSDNSDNTSYSVINGNNQFLVLSKKYIAIGDKAEAYLSTHDIDPVTFELYIEKDNEWIKYNEYKLVAGKPEVFSIIDAIKEVYGNDIDDYNEDDPSVVAKYEAVRYKVVESNIPVLTDETAEGENPVSYKITQVTENVIGNATVDRSASITNQLTTMSHESTVYKYVYLDSPVPGKSLIWQVQVYDEIAAKWLPAKDVSYRVYSGSGIPQDEFKLTDESGKIQLMFSEKGEIYHAYVAFDRNVKANVLETSEDVKSEDGLCYRVVELTEESDSDWGSLMGYANSEDFEENKIFKSEAGTTIPQGYLDVRNSDVIINTTSLKQIKVSKQIFGDYSGDTLFAFDIKQKLSEDNLITGSGLSYEIRNTEDDSFVSTGVVGADGKLQLEGGQYALISVPNYSAWQITEDSKLHWDIKEVNIIVGEEPDDYLIPLGAINTEANGAVLSDFELEGIIAVRFNTSEESGYFEHSNNTTTQSNLVYLRPGVSASNIPSDASIADYILNGAYILPTVINSVDLFAGWKHGDNDAGYTEADILKYIYKYYEKNSLTDTITLDALFIAPNEGVYNYPYNPENVPYKFVAPTDGYYFMEGWGAQGGASRCNGALTANTTGLGAYTSGYIYLKKGESIYVYVGGKGTDAVVGIDSPGGWNGGGVGTWDHGDNETGGGGGGATDFRLVNGNPKDADSLASRIMVSGAGGGRSWNGDKPGFGGTVEKIGDSVPGTNRDHSLGGSQTPVETVANGKTYVTPFGYGSDATIVGGQSNGCGGGGGGYYGGMSGDTGNGMDASASGAGGSSFISGYEGCNAIKNPVTTNGEIVHSDQSVHYSGRMFVNPVMISGADSMTQPDGSTSTGHTGDGYARITYCPTVDVNSTVVDDSTDDDGSTGEIQEYVVPRSGYYMLEAWGAQGASKPLDGQETGGKGAYTRGEVYLIKGQTIYIAIGKQPSTESTDLVSGEVNPGGWNGGGSVKYANSQNSGNGGGGATDFRLAAPGDLTKWDDFDSLKSRVMVAAGGGGGDKSAYGGGGGTLEGVVAGYSSTNYPGWYATGGTQTSAGVPGNELNTSTGELRLQSGSGNKGSFAKGGNAIQNDFGGNGGGGGYYGGGASVRPHGGGGGGSSFVSGYTGCNAIAENSTKDAIIHTNQPNHYSGMVFDNPYMKAAVNEGDGKARITYMNNDLPEGDPLSIKSAVNSISFYAVTDRTIDESTFNYALDTSDLIDANKEGRYLVGGELIGKSKVLNYDSDEYADLLYGKVEIPEYIVTCKDGKYQKNKIIAIGEQAYEGWNYHITSLIMSDSIEALGCRAFTNMELIYSDENIVYVSKNLRYSGAYALCFHIYNGPIGYNDNSVLIMNCSKEYGLYFQNTEKIFGNSDRAQFFNTIVIGEGFTTIEVTPKVKDTDNHAFPTDWVQLNDASKPKQIIYNSDITSISSNAFSGGSGLKTFIPATYEDVQYEYKDGKVISKEITKYTFYNDETGEVNIPDSFVGSCILSGNIKTVGSYAFQRCSKLDGDLVIDCSVEKLNAEIFKEGPAFKGALRISHGFNQIQNGNGGTSVQFDSSKNEMKFMSVFGGSSVISCNTFSAIDFDFRNIDTDEQHTECEHCGKVLPRMNFDEAQIFTNWASLKSVSFGSAVKDIGTAANGGTGPMFPSSLRTLVFSEGVEVIGDRIFQDLSDLGNITGNKKSPDNQMLSMPSTLKTVGRCAYRNCQSLSGLEFRGAEDGSSNIKELYPFSIQLCTNMRGTLVIPASMEIMSVKCLHASNFDTVVFMENEASQEIMTKIFSSSSSTESHDHIFDYEGTYPVTKIYVNENATTLISSLKANKVTGPANQGWFYNVKNVEGLITTYKTGTTPWK